MQGNDVAIVWSGLNTCQVFGRVIDTSTATLMGSDAVMLHDCASNTAAVIGIVANATGYTVMYSEAGDANGQLFTNYYQLDVGADMTPVGGRRAQ